ncbi:hypothetical protein ACQP04_02965 [Pseudonocardia halophobica]|uniref:hypothetical protein n=1 Tax=Pseudonocardia halophobica TaxID=29401 RepID=UPI003D93573A
MDLSAGLMTIRRQLVQNGWQVIESGRVKVLQETLGRSSVTLNADTYTSAFHDVAAIAAEAVAALIPCARTGSATHRPRTHSPEGDHPEVRSPQVEGGGPLEPMHPAWSPGPERTSCTGSLTRF